MKIFLNEAALVMESMSFIDILFLSLILVLIISFVTLIYFIKVNKVAFNKELEKKEEKEEEKNEYIEEDNGLNHYEDDQEKTAIISYSELIKNSKSKKIVYEDENEEDCDIDIRKISVKEEEKKDINYKNEEEFLKKLKDLTRS